MGGRGREITVVQASNHAAHSPDPVSSDSNLSLLVKKRLSGQMFYEDKK
jgi:hypothetical protein